MRRIILLVGCAGVLLTVAQKPRASDTEVEVATYEGHTTGHWTCGPQGRVRYAGVGAQVRYSGERASAEHGLGPTLVVGAAAEGARVRFVGETAAEAEPETSADANLFAGAGFRFGYHWQYVGFELGALMWSGWDAPGETGRGAFPQLELSLGRRDVAYGVAGLGAPNVTWITRPAVPYVGVGWHCPVGCRFELRAGKFRAGPGVLSDFGSLVDLSWYVPVRSTVDLRASLAMGSADTIERQASLGLAFRYE